MAKNTILHDAFDREVYHDLFNQSKELQNITARGIKRLKTFEELTSDVFFSLYKMKPELLKREQLMPEYWLNHEQMNKLMESSSYQDLRQYTTLDELGSGLGSKALLESLLHSMQQDQELKEAVEKADKKDGYGQASNKIPGLETKIRQVVEQAVDKAVEELSEVENIIWSWGLNQGEFQRLPYEKKLEILQVLRGQQKFKDMTKMVGRMRSVAAGSRKAKLQQRVELHSITQGADINHVLPQELAVLLKPALKLDFYRRLTEKQLLQYDLRHPDYVGQGPIVVLLDTSSSMRAGNREIWSKAVALGLAEIAEKEKRAFSYALFASRLDQLIYDDFLPGQRSPNKLLKLATEFIGGGTNFDQPLNWAMGKINESRFKKADIVMITDGECEISDQFLKELQKSKAEKEFRIFSILIGYNPQELRRWSDEVWEVENLLDENISGDLFQKI